MGSKKPVVMAFCALVLYAFTNVALEQKLSKYSVFSLMTYFYLIMLPLSVGGWIFLKSTDKAVEAPSGWMVALTMIVAVAYFAADSCFVGAYTHGGDLFTISSIVVLFPALATLVRYFWVGGRPNIYQITGYILAAVAVLLVAKGSSINQAIASGAIK